MKNHYFKNLVTHTIDRFEAGTPISANEIAGVLEELSEGQTADVQCDTMRSLFGLALAQSLLCFRNEELPEDLVFICGRLQEVAEELNESRIDG